MFKELDFMFRMFDGELTEEEEEEIKRLNALRDSKKKSTNAYCACGGDTEGEELLLLDSH